MNYPVQNTKGRNISCDFLQTICKNNKLVIIIVSPSLIPFISLFQIDKDLSLPSDHATINVEDLLIENEETSKSK